MPIYIYRCENCRIEVEEIQKFSDPPLTECTYCKKNTLTKIPGKAFFKLKGKGWFKDGYEK